MGAEHARPVARTIHEASAAAADLDLATGGLAADFSERATDLSMVGFGKPVLR